MGQQSVGLRNQGEESETVSLGLSKKQMLSGDGGHCKGVGENPACMCATYVCLEEGQGGRAGGPAFTIENSLCPSCQKLEARRAGQVFLPN